MDRLAPPSAKHLLGADGAGRDILTRLIHGARISLVVGLAATTVTIVVAAAIGVPSGYLGGRYDIVVQRFVDGWNDYIAAAAAIGNRKLRTVLRHVLPNSAMNTRFSSR